MAHKALKIDELFSPADIEPLQALISSNVMLLSVDGEELSYINSGIVPKLVVDETFGNIFSSDIWPEFSTVCLAAAKTRIPQLFWATQDTPKIVVMPIIEKGQCHTLVCWARSTNAQNSSDDGNRAVGRAEELETAILTAISGLADNPDSGYSEVHVADTGALGLLLPRVAAFLKATKVEPSRLHLKLKTPPAAFEALLMHYKTLGVNLVVEP